MSLAVPPLLVLSPLVSVDVDTQAVRLVSQPGALVAVLGVLELNSYPIASCISLLVEFTSVGKFYALNREFFLAWTISFTFLVTYPV